MYHQHPSFYHAKGTEISDEIGDGGEGRCGHAGSVASV